MTDFVTDQEASCLFEKMPGGKGQHESSARSLKLTRSLSLPLVLLV